MTEAEVLADKCSNCGSERRPGADYCYNCGFKVIDDPAAKDSSDKTILEASIKSAPDNRSTGEPSADRIPMPDIALMPEPAVPIERRPKKKLRSASSIQRRNDRQRADPKVVVWEEHTGPGLSFIISSIILIIISAFILLAALYLR